MNFDLSEDQVRVFDQVLKFARTELNHEALAREEKGGLDRALWEKCGKLALPGLTVSAELGGGGLDALTAAAAMEALGYGCLDNGLTFSLAAHLVAVCMPLASFGSDSQKKRWFPGLCDGRFIGCHAMTEAETGSDAFSMKAAAALKGSKYLLNGRKIFSTNSSVADLAIVFAMTDEKKGALGGVTCFAVDLDLPGVQRSRAYDKMGLRTSPTGELFFDNVELSEAEILGKPGAGLSVFTHTMNWERTLLFAAHCGTLRRILEGATDFARRRKQFGQSIGKYQAISHRLVDLRLKLEASRLLVYKAAKALESARGVCMEACMAKLYVSESLSEAALASLQIHGGFGYMRESGVEREVRDSLASTIYSGTSEIQRNLLANWLKL